MKRKKKDNPRGDETYKDKIRAFYKDRKRMPSFEEMRELLGFASKNAVAKLVDRLEEVGFIRRDKGRLVPQNLASDLRVLGLVEAGFPTQAEEDVLDTMSLDEFLVENKEATFMLRVKGDSMIDAGIFEGDMVLVDRSKTAREGDVVIAAVDGAFTMKYLRSKNGRFYLEAANKKYKPIAAEGELKVEAVVTAIIRKYS